jgi:Zn-finger nucleic acid-binding protein
MSIECPRCNIATEALEARPRGAEKPHHVDRCARCGGIWLDRAETSVVCPTVAGLHERKVEITALGAPASMRCPRCKATPYTFRLLDLELDVCLGCGGVWLDARDQEEGMVRGLGDDAHRSDRPSKNPYRAVEQARAQVRDLASTRCARCGDAAEVKATMMAADGLVCRRCWAQALHVEIDT